MQLASQLFIDHDGRQSVRNNGNKHSPNKRKNIKKRAAKTRTFISISSDSSYQTFSMGILREAPCSCGAGNGQSTVRIPSLDRDDLIISMSVPSGK